MVTRECSKIVQARACEGLLRIRCRRIRSVALQDLCLAPQGFWKANSLYFQSDFATRCQRVNPRVHYLNE